MKPNKANIRKWVTALRSGKYKQGFGALEKSRGTYCCLGVAAIAVGWKKDMMCGLDDLSKIPMVKKRLGLDDNDPLITNDVRAIDANDSLEWSFKKIATAIEKRYLKSSK